MCSHSYFSVYYLTHNQFWLSVRTQATSLVLLELNYLVQEPSSVNVNSIVLHYVVTGYINVYFENSIHIYSLYKRVFTVRQVWPCAGTLNLDHLSRPCGKESGLGQCFPHRARREAGWRREGKPIKAGSIW